MKTLSDSQQNQLKQIFGDRLSFDTHERKMYGHDASVMPPLAQLFIWDTTPAAVVQPEKERQLLDLVRLANANKIALTPRGRATARYGGAVPTHGGIVVDFSRMHHVLDVKVGADPDEYTVTVEPGMTWKELELELEEIGLALRLYPTSAPSSTVGGWLAQGGAGIGSNENGYFRDNVVSARVVLPNGVVDMLQGGDLDLVSDAEGITGFITQVELKVRLREDTFIAAYSFGAASELERALSALRDASLPVWSVTFFNPTMARMRNQVVPPRDHSDMGVDDVPTLPPAYIALFAFPDSRRAAIEPQLPDVVGQFGSLLKKELAQHEWDDRYNPLRIKRLAASLIPAEVIVPLGQLTQTLYTIYERITQPLALEGTVINGTEVALRGFIPHDEREAGFNFAHALSLTMLDTAKEFGGRAYSTGLYFTQEREAVLGRTRVKLMQDHKAAVDPNEIMNPGKVIATNPINWTAGLTNVFEPITRNLGNRAKMAHPWRVLHLGTDFGEHPTAMKGLPAQLVWNAYACAQCGYCLNTCTQYQEHGWESAAPRGKFFYLRELLQGKETLDQRIVDRLLMCLKCERCTVECQLAVEIVPNWGLSGMVHDSE